MQLMAYLQRYSPFYQARFRQEQINVADIRSLLDLPYLPLTSKQDMQAHNMDFLCVSPTKVREYMATSGTLGRPVTIALTENDLQRLAYNEHQSFLCTGGQETDRYQLMLTLDRQFMAGIAYYSGIRRLGAALIRTGPGLPALQWDTILRMRTNTLVAVPSFLLKMIEWAKEHGIDLSETPVQKTVCIGENIRNADFSLNALGQKIQSQWPIQLYATYAATEMQTAFTECGAGKGGHAQPDLIWVEILDEQGKVLPAGIPGEVVVTTLGVEGMPLLRYRTGDIAAAYDEPCTCGRHSKRLGPVLGRKQQMVKYKGTTLYPPAVFEVLNRIAFVKEYVVEVSTGEQGTDELRLHLFTELPADACEQELRSLLRSGLRVVPILHFCSYAEIQQIQFPPESRKQIRFIDNRADCFHY